MSYKNQFNFFLKPDDFKDLATLHNAFTGFCNAVEREFKAVEIGQAPPSPRSISSFVSGGGGSGGGTSVRTSVHVEQNVAAAATVIVSFPSVGTSQYGVMGYLLKSNGDVSGVFPLVPPRTDSRSATQVSVDVQEAGTLHTFIVLNP